ncbi:hypothetical protein MG293_002028 [Ovis ammon polii]|uniref:Endothelin-2 n=1 Tax=Ovis ammon polii TaxID=230172 RepID=A0AAD4UNF8_OVIAM|nr:hypothetical protein MG293_002028 [Ovis ammon polii]
MPTALCSIALALLVALHEGKSQATTTPIPEQPAPLPRARGSHLRTRRCSCSSWLDKECVYFCHLDIIWVNTPGAPSPLSLPNPDYALQAPLNARMPPTARDIDEVPSGEAASQILHPQIPGPSMSPPETLSLLTPQCWTSVTLPQRTFPDSQSRLSIPAIRLQATFRLNTSHYVFICLI